MSTLAPRVLIVEDEPQMRRFLRVSLTAHGYRVEEATSAAEALRVLTASPPELLLLDLGLPDADGIDLTRQLREWSRVPIIVISARGREDDKVAALDAGADDYLTKPFGVNELLARMRVAMRHAELASGDGVQPVLTVGALRIDFVRREVSGENGPVHLTPIEYKLLALLARNAGRAAQEGGGRSGTPQVAADRAGRGLQAARPRARRDLRWCGAACWAARRD
jgi:two-component system KDP operon response regulator KdpE